MNIIRFTEIHRPQWEALEEILKQMRQGQTLSRDHLRNLSHLYRTATSDFAFAHSHYPDSEITQYLNRLVAESHGVIYKRRRIRIGRFATWLFLDVPGIFWKHIYTFLFAWGLFLTFFTVGFLGSEFVPEGEKIFLFFSISDPEDSYIQSERYISMTEENIAKGTPFAVYEDEYKTTMTSSIMFNNIRVSLYAFVGGILAGIVTFWVLAMNSMMVGAFFHIFYRHDIIFDFWNTTLLHGMIEITMMFMAAMAGFIIAKGLLFPGPYPRRDSLRKAGLDAVQLALVIAMWDGIAAIFEGFVTGAGYNGVTRLAINLTTASALIAYFFVGGYIGYHRRVKGEPALRPDDLLVGRGLNSAVVRAGS